jgi:polyisoprenoid-binding protein YceI
MYRFILGGLVAATFFLSPATIQAQDVVAGVEKYTLESPHTQIMFTVNHLGFSHSTGKFLTYEGGFTLDRANLEKSSVDVTIKTASVDLGDQKWNDHMKNADFFNVEKFPDMTFKSTGIVLTGADTADITGDLTMIGVTKPVTLKVKHNKSGPHPMGERFMAGFDATAEIKRSDFGMSYGLPMVGDDVKITISVEGIQDGYQGAAKGKE